MASYKQQGDWRCQAIAALIFLVAPIAVLAILFAIF